MLNQAECREILTAAGFEEYDGGTPDVLGAFGLPRLPHLCVFLYDDRWEYRNFEQQLDSDSLGEDPEKRGRTPAGLRKYLAARA